ncbi:MAG: hypothetical protein H7338_03505 [Candidatus Sericytochromatia bacterium]|nr:hypothetical protein [Candidatus Sericytochromatia bacterium]
MKDFRDRFIRESAPTEAEQQQRPQPYIGPSPPQPVEAARRPEAAPARSERAATAKQAYSPVAAARNKSAAQTVVVSRSLVSVWGDQSFLADRVGTVENGELLSIVEEAEDWLHIRCGTRLAGWVRVAELAAFQDPYTGLGERDDLF